MDGSGTRAQGHIHPGCNKYQFQVSGDVPCQGYGRNLRKSDFLLCDQELQELQEPVHSEAQIKTKMWQFFWVRGRGSKVTRKRVATWKAQAQHWVHHQKCCGDLRWAGGEERCRSGWIQRRCMTSSSLGPAPKLLPALSERCIAMFHQWRCGVQQAARATSPPLVYPQERREPCDSPSARPGLSIPWSSVRPSPAAARATPPVPRAAAAVCARVPCPEGSHSACGVCVWGGGGGNEGEDVLEGWVAWSKGALKGSGVDPPFGSGRLTVTADPRTSMRGTLHISKHRWQRVFLRRLFRQIFLSKAGHSAIES